MAQTASILLQSIVATSIYNLDSSRFQKASLDTRSEGWTEAWGGKDDKNTSDVAETIKVGSAKDPNTGGEERHQTSSGPNYWESEDNSIRCLLATPHPQLPLVLTQHRPAWLEQMVLRMANIPHVVVNSTHISSEATGQMPYLADYHQRDPSRGGGGGCGLSNGDEYASNPPVLVGRCHPTNLTTTTSEGSQNSILQYLTEYRKVDLDVDALSTEHQRGLAQAYLNMIQSDLTTALLYLRFEDHDAWEQVYRKQYIHASLPSGGQVAAENASWIVQLRGRFQSSMERAVERRRLLEYSRNHNVERVVGRARNAYQSLERQLGSVVRSSSDANQRTFLLGTDRPALVDATLWAHLADALCDVHLVVVLTSFPRLVKYFQDLYQIYFATREKSSTDTWEEWNEGQNLSNAFQRLPILTQTTRIMTGKSNAFKDAIDLMQNLSLQHQDLQEVLGAVKAKRDNEAWPTPSKPNERLLYRWRMGEDLDKMNQTAHQMEENPVRKKLLRDQIRNDQMWLSGVAGVSVAALLLLQAGATGPD